MGKSWFTTSFNYPAECADLVIKAQAKAKGERKSFSQIVLDLVDKYYVNNTNNNNNSGNQLTNDLNGIMDFFKVIDNFVDSEQRDSKDLLRIEGQLARLADKMKYLVKEKKRKEMFGR